MPNVQNHQNGATKVSQDCIDLIAHFEGCELKAYKDPIGIPTIGFGATFYENGQGIKIGTEITFERAKKLLEYHIVKFTDVVLIKVTRPLKQNELDALVSFCFNCGVAYKLTSGHYNDYNIWKLAQNRTITKEYWETLAITASGKKLNGLIHRRKAEAELYFDGSLPSS